MYFAVVLTAVFLATGQGPHSSVSPGDPTSTGPPSSTAPPSPAVSITASGPVLTQQSPTTWTTTVLLAESSACLTEIGGNPAKPAKPMPMTKDLSYHLVTTSPDYVVVGTAVGTAEVNTFPATDAVELDPVTLSPTVAKDALPPSCTALADETTSAETEVSLAFTLKAPFPTVPLTATLVIDDPRGQVPVTGTQLMTVRALVTGWQYLWFPIWCALAMAVAFLIGIALVAWARRPKWKDPRERENPWRGDPWQGDPPDKGPGFLRRPIYASAAWSFTDSPATTISAAATVLAGVFAGAGAASTLLPGIQVDHFAVLLAVWAVVVVAAPIVFGFFNTATGASRGLVPDNAALLRFPADQAVLHAPGGASLTFGGGATVGAPGSGVSLKPGDTLPVPPDSKITVNFARDTGTMVLPGDSSVVLTGFSSVQVGVSRGGQFSVPADAMRDHASRDVLTSGEEIRPPQPPDSRLTQDGVTLKAVGFVTVTVPTGTQVHYPFPDQGIIKTFSQDTYLRVPMGDKTVVADMRSLIPASLVTILGIGGQLGLLAMLAGELSALPAVAHNIAWAIVGALAAAMVGYAVVSTAELASSRPGSALASDSQSSYIL
jgi:hypothetical protein